MITSRKVTPFLLAISENDPRKVLIEIVSNYTENWPNEQDYSVA